MPKRIVYNRKSDGGVSVYAPAQNCLAMMACGGRWNGERRGFLHDQIDRQIERGIRSDVAQRFVLAMQFGGCTTAEALEILRDRDCAPHGTAIELWDSDEIPSDRWFRDAWVRSHNGGPIAINRRQARRIHAAQIEIRKTELLRDLRLRAAIAESDAEALRIGLRGDHVAAIAVRSVLRDADDPEHLRSLWPAALGPRPHSPVIPANLFGVTQ